MAEAAAPAAPATPAAPAPTAPADAAAPLDPGDLSTVRDTPPPSTEQRLAKPLRPIPSLPGVFPDEDPFPAEPSVAADGKPGAATRGPDGRFLASPSSASPAPSVGEHTLEPASADPATPEPFEFAGEKYASREAAEQNFKSLRGQHKPILALAKQVGGVDKIAPTFASAAESARGWKAEADRLRAELAGRQPAQPAVATPPTTTQPTKTADDVADVDWELYAEVKKLATERNEPWKAEQWLITQVRKLDQQRIDKMLDERDAPQKAQRARDAQAAQTETLFASLADYTHEDGSPAFPELSDEAAAFEVGRMWASLGLPPAHALTPQGAIAAIALYRMSRPKESQAKVAAPAPPPSPSAPAQPTDTLSAAELVDGRPTVASVPGNGATTPSAEAARIIAALRSSTSPRSSMLGFEP